MLVLIILMLMVVILVTQLNIQVISVLHNMWVGVGNGTSVERFSASFSNRMRVVNNWNLVLVLVMVLIKMNMWNNMMMSSVINYRWMCVAQSCNLVWLSTSFTDSVVAVIRNWVDIVVMMMVMITEMNVQVISVWNQMRMKVA